MALNELASELLLQIYRHCTSISDVVNLSLTCRRMHTLLPSTQKLSILFSAAEAEFGPLEDAIQLVTYTRQSTSTFNRPPLSYPLLRQVVSAGRVARRWEQLYQLEKWAEDNYMNRRGLTTDERFRIRRAVYRYWLYTHAFHNASYLRTMRLYPPFVAERCQMLRQWSNAELIEIEDVRSIIRGLLAFQICPSDGTVQQRRGGFHWQSSEKRWRSLRSSWIVEDATINSLFHSSRDSCFAQVAPLTDITAHTTNRDLSMDGFGDEIDHYHFIETMLKLDPGQIISLYDNVTVKRHVEDYVASLGEWFPNNGQTWASSCDLVLHKRGFDVLKVRQGIEDGKLGIAVDDKLLEVSVLSAYV